MSPEATVPLRFESTLVDALPGLHAPAQAAPVDAPRLVLLNEPLAVELGWDPEWLRTPEGVATLAGQRPAPGSVPVALAYAGHQFGMAVPRLGDGRALLLGEVVDAEGRRRDVHLKGSGRTVFARGGDGLAALGPMLREHVVSEAMHGLGIPTTRSLAVIATGRDVLREDGPLPGAILVRVAASHLRVGTFEYAARHQDPAVLRRLLDHAIARHHPHAADAEVPALAFFAAVRDAQAALVAQWLHVGFVHGVMNTDNVAVSGETIDYGPCAFLDAFDPRTSFSSIDHQGRYAYRNQAAAMQWNLARFAETLVPLVDDDQERAVAALSEELGRFSDRFDRAWRDGLRAKLALDGEPAADTEIGDQLLQLMAEEGADFTGTFRGLAGVLRDRPQAAREQVLDRERFDSWAARWREQVAARRDLAAAADALDRVNPRFVPRNHRVEEALDAAVRGDDEPVRTLVEVVSRPFDEQPGRDRYAGPGPAIPGGYVTFCGT
ncbi:protein adenylyltransferase SelO [Patulibacter defluvii]|uniref:protein adenylyltransferase SelO n=1 Tax=Patulibacter defluvii TaxID=3095358 RepID=UPI002A75E5FE|nr:YdiU family protein [Patulibacter sp. DM4]